MRFPIDVIMLDANQIVIGIRRNLKPWRLCICCRGTKSIVETACNACEVTLGDQLRLDVVVGQSTLGQEFPSMHEP